MDDRIKKIKRLAEEVNRHAYNYYVLDMPTISDREYDKMYYELVELEKETGYVLPYSPTQRVGDTVLDGFTKHTHKGRLWSLDKAQNIKELSEWDERNRKAVAEYNSSHYDKLPELTYVITKKFDGLTINCTYDKNGIMAKAATRGTGTTGEDVTAQAKTIRDIPLKIDDHRLFEVHGEVIMTKKSFEEYNKTADVPLKNLRNGAAGALRNLNVKETARRKLSAFFYDVGYSEGIEFKSYREMLYFIKMNGLAVDDYIKVCRNIEEIEKEINYVKEIRPDLSYDIDGVVIAVDDMRTRDFLGYTIKFPKWAIAFKFEAEEATTILKDVEWNVGRSGRVVPTAILEPVEFGGVTVKRATLNNMDDIKKKGVKVGSRIWIRRSNDVIPEITGVSEDFPHCKDILPPEFCPSCRSRLVLDGAHYFCENTLSCSPQMVKSIVHYGSREAMNIEGFSEKTAEQLFENLNVKSIADLYMLTKKQLLTLDKFKDKKAQNLLDAIEKSKNCNLAAFLFSLGIPNVGRKTADDLAKRFKSIDAVMRASMDELTEVRDIGGIVAESVVDYFSQEKVQKSIKDLLNTGVKPQYEEEKIEESIFSGKTVVVTGSLENYTRTSIKEKLESLGAKVSGSVSSKTNYVLAGNEAGSKKDKAMELGVPIISEEEFENMIKQ